MRFVAVAALFFVAAPVAADEGEWLFALNVIPEVAWVSHPLTSEAAPFGPSSSTTFLPRVGGQLSYGLTNSFAILVGADGTAFPGPLAQGVVIDGVEGNVSSFARIDLLAPVGVAYRYDSGTWFSGQLELSGGPAAVGWLGNVAVSPDEVGDNSLPIELGVKIPDLWSAGVFGRAALMLNVGRIGEGGIWPGFYSNGFLLDVGIVSTVTWTDALRAVHVGVLLRPSWAWGGAFL